LRYREVEKEKKYHPMNEAEFTFVGLFGIFGSAETQREAGSFTS